MTRLRGHSLCMCLDELKVLATSLNAPIKWRRARCEHGKTTDQTCRSCDGGWVQDTSEYANLPDDVVGIAISDDGRDVAFVELQ